MKPEMLLPNPPTCEHPKCVPAWDGKACEGKDSYWIREHYPRFEGVCPDCGQSVIVYADLMQYIAGDY